LPERRGAANAKPMNARQAASPPNFDIWLDRQLHSMFDQISAEPLPQDLVDLVRQQSKKPR